MLEYANVATSLGQLLSLYVDATYNLAMARRQSWICAIGADAAPVCGERGLTDATAIVRAIGLYVDRVARRLSYNWIADRDLSAGRTNGPRGRPTFSLHQ